MKNIIGRSDKDLAREKLEVEIAKLKAETKNLSRPWWKKEPIATLTLAATLISTFLFPKAGHIDIIQGEPVTNEQFDNKRKNPWTPNPKPVVGKKEITVTIPYDFGTLHSEIMKIFEGADKALKRGDDPIAVVKKIIESLKNLRATNESEKQNVEQCILFFEQYKLKTL